MIKKGIILAGGQGTRMSPLTKAVNKQLLPVYDKPLIFYPLSILMLAKIKDILIIVNKGQLNQYKKILPNGNNLGIKISYLEQSKPRGLPDAFVIGEKFIGKENVAMILGDNFFYGQNLTSKLLECTKIKRGAKVVLYKVQKPEMFGVAKINKKNKIISIKEKPKHNFYVNTGIYILDPISMNFIPKGYFDMPSLFSKFIANKLKAISFPLGEYWLDIGRHGDFKKANDDYHKIFK